MDAKAVAWAWVTADQRLVEGPLWLLGAVLTSDGTGNADATIRNGIDTGAEVVMVLRAPTAQTVPAPLPAPLYLRRGLFVDVGSNVGGVLVLYAMTAE